jgi:serine/threonine protein phosphatase PrpC
LLQLKLTTSQIQNFGQTRDVVTTASTAIIVGDRLLVANVGDPRAVIARRTG